MTGFQKPTNQKWLDVFMRFIGFIRIRSKEVSSVDQRGSKLQLWNSQKIFLQKLCNGLDNGIRMFYCLKARQLGVTTISLVIDVFWMAMHPGIIGCLVTDTDSNREANRDLIKSYVESFPAGFFGASFSIVANNKNFISFSNGSRLDLLVAGTRNKSNWGEGKGYAFAHLTECANYGSEAGLNSFMESLAETHPDRLFIFESTAKSFNHWYDMWEEAKRDRHTKMGIFIGWWSKDVNRIGRDDSRFDIYGADDPDEDEQKLIDTVKDRYGFKVSMEQLAWMRWKQSSLSSNDNDLNQNTPWTEEQCFVLSGSSFFQTRVLQKDWERLDMQQVGFAGYRCWLGNDFWSGRIERIDDQERINEVDLRVWEEPVKDGVYAIGCDPAYGRNDWKDRHAISVWRCFADKIVQVAEYADNNVETRQCAWVLAFLSGTYKNSMVNVELTGGAGKAVMAEFDNLRQQLRSDMYHDKSAAKGWDDFLGNAQWYLYTRPDTFSGGGALKGWESTHSSKFYMCNAFRDSYATNLIDISSIPLIEEMLKVVQEGSTISAPGRAKDDRVFAAMLANLTWKEQIRQRLINENYTYDRQMALESGDVHADNVIVSNIVANFFKNAEERFENAEEPRTWLKDRGLG